MTGALSFYTRFNISSKQVFLSSPSLLQPCIPMFPLDHHVDAGPKNISPLAQVRKLTYQKNISCILKRIMAADVIDTGAIMGKTNSSRGKLI